MDVCIAELVALDDFDSTTTTEVVNMETVKGIVEKINCNANGYYGVKIGDTWYGAGKYEPKFNEGYEVQFGYTMNGKYANMDFKSVEIINAGTAGNSSTDGGPPSSSASSSGSSSGAAKGGVNWDLKDKRITYLASRKDALSLVAVLTANEAITLPAKKADKYGALCSLVNDITNEMFYEVYGENFEGSA